MAIIGRDGMAQTKAGIPLYMIGSDTISFRIGSSEIAEINSTGLQVNENILADGYIKPYNIAVDSFITLYAHNQIASQNKDIYGIFGSITNNTTLLEVAECRTNSLILPYSADISGLSSGDLIYAFGTKSNDGYYEIDVLVTTPPVPPVFDGEKEIGIKTSPNYEFSKNAISIETGMSGAHVAHSKPAYYLFDESDKSWYFGYFSSPSARSTFRAVGKSDSPYGATDYSLSNPDISTLGSAPGFSGAKQVGLNITGLTNVTQANVQDAIGEIDAALIAAITLGTPAFLFAEAAAAGTATTVARTDATIALFLDALPTSIQIDAGSKGTSGKAARHDHKHIVASGAPVDVGISNQEGTSLNLARQDHVHKTDAIDGPTLKSGAIALSNGAALQAITFTTQFGTACTSVTCTMENTTDPTPYDFVIRIRLKSVTGFTAYFSAVDSANYILNWQIFLLQCTYHL